MGPHRDSPTPGKGGHGEARGAPPPPLGLLSDHITRNVPGPGRNGPGVSFYRPLTPPANKSENINPGVRFNTHIHHAGLPPDAGSLSL